ncbi:MAG: tyrosine--tRNA ligase [Anaerolineaceae bacterium]|nr:tyrosine--tRNA ligase [Anaerolineaceae bacterium]
MDSPSPIFEELQWRGQVHSATEGFAAALARGPLTVYNGFDPTGASLHVGHLIPILGLARLQRAGHTPIALVGGGTGLIGDPSGKTRERQLLSRDVMEANVAQIRIQLAQYLDFEVSSNRAQLRNNLDWLEPLSLLEFMRDTGKHFTVNYMLAKDSVKSRIQSEEGISLTEFVYMPLQAYDFLWLNENANCQAQLGGSDQWGNIVAGVDLIRRKRGSAAYGLVYPLLTTASGAKFGKSEGGAIWLDAELTSPYRFYQYWFNCADEDVVAYLKTFTWLDRAEIHALGQERQDNPGARVAQRTLAREVTRLVHGESELTKAERATQVLFGGDLAEISVTEWSEIGEDVPYSERPAAELQGDGTELVTLLAESGLAQSRGEARRLIRGGGAYLNHRRVTDEGSRIRQSDCLHGQFLLLRVGRRKLHLLRLLPA